MRELYCGAVRWTSRSWLWGLLAVLLLFGLVLMHHTPGHGGHDAELAADPLAATSVVAMTDSPAADCPCPATDHDSPLPSGTGGPGATALLHLCLAVLVALGAMVAAGLLRHAIISHTGGNLGSAGRRIGLEHVRPPVPVPRRLAALCLLRL